MSTWASIPDSAKEKDGYWYGDYYGVLAFEVNTDMIDKVPADWADLLKPDYKNAVALAGDPRSASRSTHCRMIRSDCVISSILIRYRP